MNRRKISALLLSCTLAMNISSFNEIVLADENKGEEVQKESHNESNCIAGDYHEVNNGNAKNTENTPIINGIKVNKQLIDINYSQGVTINPKYIVIHDTDNRQAGANAMANRNYFANHPNAKASAHYIIDEGNIIQALEDTWKGWHVGDGNNPNINNSTTIAIELCVNKGNDFDKTLENGVELTKYLMNKYNIPAENVVMHRDASGKTCSRMMIEDRPSLWPYFKDRISGGDGSLEDDGLKPKMQGKVTNASVLNVRESPSTSGRIVHKLNRNQVVGIYEELNGWYKIDYIDGVKKKYGYVSKDYISIINENPEDEETNGDIEIEKPSVSANKKGIVKVNSALNMRSGPGSNYGVIGTLRNNDEVEIIKEVDGWYEIKFNGKSGYVSSQYIKVVDNESNEEKPVEPEKPSVSVNKQGVVKVNSALNMRSGPGSNYGVIGTLRNNDEVEIIKEVDGWYEIKFNGKIGYVSSQYIKVVDNESNEEKPVEPEKPSVSVNKQGVVKVNSALNMRSGPGSNYGVIGTLRNNDKVEIIKEVDGWYEIKFNGKVGYASKSYITIVNEGSNNGTDSVIKEGTVYGVSTNLNVRTGPGTSYQVIGYLLSGDKVKILGEENGWYKVQFNASTGTKNGYVSKDYIKV
ncbi:SH3 domain-containing protein [Clostridium perfringens]|uniref:SH3 domain-containing protein n=2 Tax=Clostridium perfringens TaxID=1502 RepID=UPI0023304CA3|nr:SH3 domain-containing protein [Clostridium perfringens]MDB2060789.1 SH3 domain-containing protein [Clostridium perfringens]MDB2066425.1 SH3 domain-containing protein [Clostridium perfringens]